MPRRDDLYALAGVGVACVLAYLTYIVNRAWMRPHSFRTFQTP